MAHILKVGETVYIVEDWMNADDAALQAFNTWQVECHLFVSLCLI